MIVDSLPASQQASFLRLLLNSTQEGFYAIDVDGIITLCNKAFVTMLGFDSESEIIGRNVHDLIHHSHADGTHYSAADCPIGQTARGGVGRTISSDVFFRKDGTSIPVEYRVEPVIQDGTAHGAVCTFLDISDRLQKDVELAALKTVSDAAAERLDLALSSGAMLGSWVWDIKNDRITGDERFMRTFGLDPKRRGSALPIKEAMQSIHPDDVARVQKAVEASIARGTPYRAEYRVRDADGGWRWLEASGRVEKNADGEATRFPGVLFDINDQKKSERDAQLLNAQYSGLFGAIEQGFCVIEMIEDKNGKPVDYRFLETNAAFDVQTGMGASQGKTMREIIPDHEDHWFELYGKVAKSGESVRVTEYSAVLDRWFDIFAFRTGLPEDRRVGVLFSNITEFITTQHNLRESEEHLNLMLESATDYAIVSMDERGQVIRWSQGAEQIFGFEADEIIGRTLEVIFTPEDREAGTAQHEMKIAAATGRANDERWHMRKNGERFYASGIMASMTDDDGRVKGYVKIARDMTAHQTAQEALIEARNAAEAANIAKTEFLANMSHEIRTPMNAVIGLSNLLAMSEPLSASQKEFINTLQLSADSLLALINDLLDIAKIEARSVELERIPFSVAQLVQEVISMMAMRAKESGLKFTTDGECVKNRMFIGDPSRLRQIVVNLCSNALKFTDAGSVHVSVSCEPSNQAGREYISIAVRDTGIGIGPDKLETIFQKFVQADTTINRKYGGTGLGLAITKTLTEIMGGTIEVKSQIGIGSCFTIRIPLDHANDEEVAETDMSLTNTMESMVEQPFRPKVLLVEDYAANVLVAKTFLERFGYSVDVAGNGVEALQMTADNPYVAILMDVQMHGMNGLEATRLIRAREMQKNEPRSLIIGMTAHAMHGDRERCLGVGMDDYVAKPFNPDELKAKLAAAISAEA